jgi:hypothetical protein
MKGLRKMGCDIHINIEKKVNGQWFWHGDKNLDERRYIRFAVLANVRNNDNIKCISEPKGFPIDASFQTKESFDYWSGDLHSSSFLTLLELKDYEGDNKHVLSDIVHVLSEMQLENEMRINDDDIRIVFWFDC